MTSKSTVLQKAASNHIREATALPRQTHLMRRGSVYCFRMAVPEPLWKQLRRREFFWSLHTGDLALARRKAAIESVKALAQIDAARRKLAEGKSESKPAALSNGELGDRRTLVCGNRTTRHSAVTGATSRESSRYFSPKK